jgi:chemotaxis protein MotB
VVAYLVTDLGIAPSRLSAAGYGEFHPRVPNTSLENRARNRRIDIVVLEPR